MARGVAAGCLLALLAGAGAPRPAAAQACPAGPLALVLSGGGARGIAHVGVIEVLDSLGIVPDVVVGTSMGALIGAAYAGGMSGAQIDSAVRTLPLETLFRPYDRRVLRARGTLRPLAVWEEHRYGWTLASPAARDAEVNMLISSLLLPANLRARGDFDRLPIPFRAVAAELPRANAVILRSGDLAQAVRASIAIPLVLPPVRIGGRLLVDGGLAANLPVALARAEGAGQVIAVDVTEELPEAGESTALVGEIVLGLVSYQEPDALGPHDVGIRPEVGGTAMLDFSPERLAALREAGRAAARAQLAGRACMRAAPARASRPAAAIPAVAALSGDPRVVRALELRPGALDPARLAERMAALGQADAYRAVWLTPGGTADSLHLAPQGVPGPGRRAAIGADYDSDGASRVWGAVEYRAALGGRAEAGAGLFLGEARQEVYAVARVAPAPGGRTGIVHDHVLAVRAAREDVRRFDRGGREIRPWATRELVASVGADPLFSDGWFATVGPHFHAWNEPGRGSAWSAGAVLRTGRVFPAAGDAVALESVWSTEYRRTEAIASRRFALGGVALRPRLAAVWSEDAPVQSIPPLGGVEGFPGLRNGEVRGRRSVMGGLLLTRPLAGPFALRVELAGGRSSRPVGEPSRAEYVYGAGVGLGIETWLGPVRAEYGRTTDGRDAFRVRVGG